MLDQSTNHPPLFYSGPERRKTPRSRSSAQQNDTGTGLDSAVRSIAERRGCGGSLHAPTFSPDGLSEDFQPRIDQTCRSKNVPASDPGYEYIGRSSQPQELKHKAEAAQLSLQILNPKLNDPNYLVLRERRRILTEWIKGLPQQELRVLDVGGRLQPYRSLLEGRTKIYFGVDPVFEGMLDVAAAGEHLPFTDESFDLVICTQVLNYTSDPARVIAEIHRILKPGAYLYLSAPAIFPRYHDQRWRFMPDGFLVLLSSFLEAEVVPEGYSIAGLFRSINLFFDTFIQGELARKLTKFAIFPTANVAGLMFDRFSQGKSEFTTNYSCRARK